MSGVIYFCDYGNRTKYAPEYAGLIGHFLINIYAELKSFSP